MTAKRNRFLGWLKPAKSTTGTALVPVPGPGAALVPIPPEPDGALVSVAVPVSGKPPTAAIEAAKAELEAARCRENAARARLEAQRIEALTRHENTLEHGSASWFEHRWREEFIAAHPNAYDRQAYANPMYINPEGSRLDPYDPDKGGYG